MKREFINYEQALILKELGFNEECFGNWGNVGEKEPHLSNSKTDNQSQYYGQICSAPLYQQAFRFFREEFKISSEVCIEANHRNDPNKWMFSLTYLERNTYSHSKTTYHSYEEAQSACLDKLIEIVKSK